MRGSLPIKASVLGIAWALGSIHAAADPVVQNNTINVGDNNRCILVYQNAVNTEDVYEPAKIQSLDCPLDPNDAVSVKYVWLTPEQAAYLAVAYSDESTAVVFGKHPRVLVNSVYDTVKDIFDQFGVRGAPFPLEESGYEYSLRFPNAAGDDLEFQVSAGEMPVNTLREFRLPVFQRNLVWLPPGEETTAITETDGWPGNLSYSYNPFHTDLQVFQFLAEEELALARSRAAQQEGGVVEPEEQPAPAESLGAEIASCMYFTKWVSQPEFAQYWQTIGRQFANLSDFPFPLLAAESQAMEPGVDHDPFDIQAIKRDIVQNEAYGFLEYVSTEGGWPGDFLLLQGRLVDGDLDDCGGSNIGGVSFVAIPRTLRVLVAVIEPVNSAVTVSGIVLAVDQDRHLRAEVNPSTTVEPRTGEVQLRRADGDSFVVPLQISLQYDLDDLPFAAMARPRFGNQLVGLGNGYPGVDFITDACREDRTCFRYISKPFDGLPAPTDTAITSRYVFREAYDLRGLTIDGSEIEVAGVPEVPLSVDAISESGSCPFVYVELDDGSIIYYGRVLVGANSSTLSTTDAIRLPDNARRLIIRELEPEISFIQQISFLDLDKGASPRYEPILDEMVVVAPQSEISVVIPEGADAASIRGFYEVLNSSGRS